MIRKTPTQKRWGRARRAVRALLALGVIGAAIVFFVGRFGWGLFEALCNPWTLQCWIAFAVATALAALLRSWRFAALTAALLVWSSAVVLPHALARRVDAPANAPKIRVVEANVLAYNAPTRAAIDWIRDSNADVVGVVECSFEWAGALATLKDRFPHQALRPASNPSGIGLLSRYPLRDVRIEVATDGVFPFVEASVEMPSGDVRVLVVHPPPPTRLTVAHLRNTEIAWFAERCAARDVPTIVIGDFNETQFGSAYLGFVARTGYRSARDGRLFATTWPSRLPPGDKGVSIPSWLRIAIDQCFVSRHFAPREFEVGPDIGSDHRPIVIDVEWVGG